MTDSELMQQALNALEYAADQTKPENLHGCNCLICKTIDALRDRLAQPEQEPVAWVCEGSSSDEKHAIDYQQEDVDAIPIGTMLYATPPQQELVIDCPRCGHCCPKSNQEPVAWSEREIELIDGMIEVQLKHARTCDSMANRTMADKQKGWDLERVTLLEKIKASTPPQRPWVGLTDKDIFSVLTNLQEMYNRPPTTDSSILFAYAIEAKLRERNT